MLAKLGHKVMSLNRVAVGPISVKGIATGECRSLSRHEVDLLWKVANGLSVSFPRFHESSSTSRRPGLESSPQGPARIDKAEPGQIIANSPKRFDPRARRPSPSEANPSRSDVSRESNRVAEVTDRPWAAPA